ncbi:hypothetical protein [Nostoc sp. JL23]|uniref:hypothetical protein n=1 Tax=Nostoc sp. JL23 TaxID=2815394 RepID=UPI001E0FCD2E|nr:hypothetical protein [Nostoc sp. JL23]MBN3878088.1 hypothetical protein [Nostoc sp. JL23]
MMKNFHKTLTVIVIIATFTSGCRSKDEYKKFAESGKVFAEATNSLLDTAGNITINTTSERLLSDRITTREGKLSNEATIKFFERYRELSKKDKERLELIKELRNHNQFLQDYFNKLIQLADSDSPDRSKAALESIANNLQNSGSKLIKLSPIKIDRLPSVTKIVLDARIRGALREELENRKDIIYQEITIQEKLLKLISDSMKNEIKILQDLQEYRLVIKPLIQLEDLDKDTWIETRYKVLIQDAEIISKINNVSDTLTKFKAIFIASIEGKITSNRLNNFIQETNSFSAFFSDQK